VIDVQGGTEEVAIVGNTISEWAGFESLDCWWQNATVSI
jgi:hypothetical protein